MDWWEIKVFDKESNSTTTLNKYGELSEIIKEIESEGWIFVSAAIEKE